MSERLTPIIVNHPQLSREWFEARLGNVTGSKVHLTLAYDTRNVTKTKLKMADEYYDLNAAWVAVAASKYDMTAAQYLEKLMEYPAEYCIKAEIEVNPTSSRELYKRQTVSERLSGVSADADLYISKPMLWGQMQERFAKAQYKGITGNRVEDAPLMLHPNLLCGASPDGLVIDIETGELGNLEIKCLEPWNHLYKIIKADKVPYDHIPQIQLQMWINGRDWCDFVGYDPRIKTKDLKVYIKRVERDEFFINEILVPNVVRFLDECDQDERQFYAIQKDRQLRAAAEGKILELEPISE